MNPMAFSDDFIDTACIRLKTIVSREFFEKSETLLVEIGHYAAAAAVLLVVAVMAVIAVKIHSFGQAIVGLLWGIAILTAHFVGRKFLVMCADFVERNPSTVMSGEIPKIFGVLTAILFVCVTIFGLLSVLDATAPFGGWTFASVFNTIVSVVTGIVPGALCLLYMASLFWNPELLSIGIAPGQGALSILALIYKSGARIAPIIFGGITALGAFELLGSLVSVVGSDFALQVVGIRSVLVGLLYPFFAYLLAQFLYLFIDISRAMLSLNRT